MCYNGLALLNELTINASARYYRAYLKFFTKIVLEHGITGTLEKYVFELPANFVDDEKDPI